jgi:hypothetical protein
MDVRAQFDIFDWIDRLDRPCRLRANRSPYCAFACASLAPGGH